MGDSVIATGFESAFIKSWEGWEEIDMLSFRFYKASLTEQFAEEVGVEENQLPYVYIDLDTMTIEGYNYDGVVFSRKIKLVSS